MSIALLKYDDLGSLNEIRFVVTEVLSSDVPRRLPDIRNFCLSKSVGYAYSINGIIALLEFLSFVTINGDKINLDATSVDLTEFANSDTGFASLLAERLFTKLRQQALLHDFLSLSSIKYDIPLDTIIVKSNFIPLEYSGLKNFLLKIGFFSRHDQLANILIVNKDFSDFFEYQIIRWLQAEELSDTKISYEQFQKLQSIKEQYGDDAEKFVLKYEQMRLKDHPQKHKIKIVSKIDISAGYDIISFNSSTSLTPDRLIEVKSCSKDSGFYWSKNEVETAKLKGKYYFLYLIDRNLIDKDNYTPIIIPNPFETVFLNDNWRKEAVNWYVQPSQPHIYYL